MQKDKRIVFFQVHEGKNRIIRRILKKLGYRIQKLVRTRIGSIELKGIAIGKYRDLTDKEIQELTKTN